MNVQRILMRSCLMVLFTMCMAIASNAQDSRLVGDTSFSFENENGTYLFYTESYSLSGDFEEIENLILQFIKAHKPEGELLFEEFAKKPHERAEYGEFKTLPSELQKYVAKEL